MLPYFYPVLVVVVALVHFFSFSIYTYSYLCFFFGIPHFHDLKEVSSNDIRICKTTHISDLAVGGALFVSVIIALFLQVRLVWCWVCCGGCWFQ